MPLKEKDIRRVLITGIAGSGASYLAEYIAEHHPRVEIHGIHRWHSTAGLKNLSNVIGKVKLHECDLNDFSATLKAVNASAPDAVFHLASYANVRASFDNPHSVMSNNILGTCNLFEAVRIADLHPAIQLCSTSEVYGQVKKDEVPITEENAMRPASPYAVSKVTQDLMGYMYFQSYKMNIIRTRMFAYLNPRRTDLFATSFARQVARIEAGLQKELVHGNLDSIRTIIDVRDAMEAYWMAILYGEAGEAYNIGGNTTISVGDFLELLKKQSKVNIPSRVDPALLRPADVTLQIPDLTKFTKATKWKPKYSFADSAKNLMDYWRLKVSREGEAA